MIKLKKMPLHIYYSPFPQYWWPKHNPLQQIAKQALWLVLSTDTVGQMDVFWH